MRPRDAAVFVALTDAYCAPAIGTTRHSVGGEAAAGGSHDFRGASEASELHFPAVADGDAVSFLGELTATSPRVNRIGFRLILRLVDLAPLVRGHRVRFTRLARAQRDDFLHGLDGSRWFLLRTVARLLKTITLMSYYGDPAVLRQLGYDPDANLARARALRAREGRQ